MSRISKLLLALAMVLSVRAQGSDLGVHISTVEAPAWTARGVQFDFIPPGDVSLSIASIEIAGQPPLQKFQVRCKPLKTGEGVQCDRADFTALVPGWGKVQGRLQGQFHHARRWHAKLEIPMRQLRLSLDQSGATLTADLSVRGFTYSEPTGRYAAENLDLDAKLRGHNQHWEIDLAALGGQAYADPVFFDFDALPLRASATASQLPDGWRIEHAHAAQSAVGTLDASGLIGKDFRPQQLDLEIEAENLAAVLVAYVQPFLIGTRLDGATASGQAHAQVSLRKGAIKKLAATLDNVGIGSEKLGLEIAGLTGKVEWSDEAVASSKLSWSGGALQRIPLGPSEIVFRAQAKSLELLQPWRQPLLNGALSVTRLALDDLGGAQLSADFEGAIEPIDLTALCKALGWPLFSGTLSGKLPGLRVRDDVWSIDGALEARVFDGSIRIDNLRALQPFGALPRVMADLQMRRLDLESLTGAFSFGRITGRLDGDVSGLRLLNWSPVEFDGRIYSTPDDKTRKRISQRAIDSISSIGGGPTGVLARGFLSVFDDFAYDRLGLSCALRDGVCTMDGVEAAAGEGDQRAYYIVKGRLLPRIDVVGYARKVSWNSLLNQLKAAQASDGPQLGQQSE
ncbi:MAG: YdbH domain-containing protein [Pseudomonadota bacterium]|nr:YdbH domain-containing protein [Pseudomonadota bacterium]